MPRWLRIIIGISITVAIFLTVLGFIFYNMLTAPLPEYEGSFTSGQIGSNIEIFRDSMAVPYIIAQTEKDAAFALGFVHAQERMFSMDIMRRAGEGRLSEILGSLMIPFDKMFLTIGIKKFAHDNINKVDPEVLTLLKSYSAGVNLYIREHKNKYPVEFDILGYEPNEWTPENSLVVIRMMGWTLNIAWWNDYAYTLITQKIGVDKAREILPQFSSGNSKDIPPLSFLKGETDMSFVDTDKLFRKMFGFRGTQFGSNNWVINDTVSLSGKPVIANDTHLANSAPGIWMAAVVRGGKWNAEGITLPGVPGIVVGKNQNISWAITNLMSDDADFYAEQIDSSGNNYLLDGKWVKLHNRKVKIKIKDSLDVEYIIKSTHRGPIVSGIHPFDFFYKNKGISKPVLSMKWQGNDFSDEFKAFYGINIAGNWDEFRDALKTFALPGQNFLYSDKSGNIGYTLGARIPERLNDNPYLIFDGTTSEGDWKGYVPYESLPYIYNPPSGKFATANNQVNRNNGFYITNLWEPESRVQRINELLNSKSKHSADDFKKYQMDITSPYARELTSYLINAFNGFDYKGINLNKALKLLSKWDFSFDQYNQIPAVYAVFLDCLLRNIYMDELGKDLFNEYVFITNVPYRSLLQILRNTSSIIIDNINTEIVESRDDIIRKSFIDAINELEKYYGKDMQNWQWGKLHKVKFKHAFGGVSDLLDKLINIGPYEIGGDGTTLFNTQYPFYEGIKQFPRFNHERFENNLGPAMRFVFDFAKPDEFYLVLTTGQSGHVLSEHYKDMTNLWLKGKYMKIRTDMNSIKNNSSRLLRIYKY